MQQALLTASKPRLPEGIRFCVQDVAAFLREHTLRVLAGEVDGPRLIHADPPWSYSRKLGAANPGLEGIYKVEATTLIAEHMRLAFDLATNGTRLAMWATWPKLMEALQKKTMRKAAAADEEVVPSRIAQGMLQMVADGRPVEEALRVLRKNRRSVPRVPLFTEEQIGWRPVSGGAWMKAGRGQELAHGVGDHWLGATEPLLLYTKGQKGIFTNRDSDPEFGLLKNGQLESRGEHSEKPLEWLRQMLRRWTQRGDEVLDLYCGRAPLAEACFLEGRRYIGVDMDEDRLDFGRVRVMQAALHARGPLVNYIEERG